jgi:hypothetical protein
MALAEEQRHHLINVTFHSYADMFEVPRRDIYCQYPVPQRRSVFDILPGAAPAIRKTRIFYHIIRTACRLHDRLRIFGKSAVVLHESHRRDYVTPLEGPEVQERSARPNTYSSMAGGFMRQPLSNGMRRKSGLTFARLKSTK